MAYSQCESPLRGSPVYCAKHGCGICGEEIEKPNFELNLDGFDGNSFAIMARFRNGAYHAGWTTEEIEAVIKEAKQGDYDHLIKTLMQYGA